MKQYITSKNHKNGDVVNAYKIIELVHEIRNRNIFLK